MPVTRNRLSSQKSTSSSTTTTTTSTTETSSSASTDDADLDAGSRNNNHTGDSSWPDGQSRQLRDRASLTKATNNSGQQQQNQLDAGRKTNAPKVTALNLTKRSIVVQPARVLPKRYCARPERIQMKKSSSPGGFTDPFHRIHQLKFRNANSTGGYSLLATKPYYPPTSRQSNKTGNDCPGRTFDTVDGPNRQPEQHQGSSHPLSLLRPSPTKSTHNQSAPSASPVRVSLPSTTASTSSNKSIDTLNGMQTAKPPDVTPVRANMIDKSSIASSDGAMNLAINRARSIHHQQPAPPSNREGAKKTFNVLIAVTGSVASVKLVELIRKLSSKFPQTFINRGNNFTYEATISIRVIMTENSKHFVKKDDIINCIDGTPIEVFDDADEWASWKTMGDPVLHIELKKWADLLLIAPLGANTMSKIANGGCDNLLTCVTRAWGMSKKLIYCPAMNVDMYEDPITREHMNKLQSRGYLRVDCIEKRLACGDVGLGAMASVDTIVDRVVENLLRPIPRLTSPIKSLLNQQPTYSIMSTSDSGSTGKSSSAANLFNVSNSGGQIVFNDMRPSEDPMIARKDGPSTGQSLLPPPNNNNRVQEKGLPQLKKINNNTNDTKQTSAIRPSSRPNLVKSLKNLNAVNSDKLNTNLNGNIPDNDASDNDEDHDVNEDFYADANLDLNSNPEMDGLNYDIDPSKLLEQSLMTDDDNSLGDGPNPVSDPFNSNSSSSNNWMDQFQRAAEMNFNLPFNTSKFLTMCYVKERDCFNCAICKNDYKNRKSMSRHLREQHVRGNIYKCIPCDLGFKRREKLIKHNRDKHTVGQM